MIVVKDYKLTSHQRIDNLVDQKIQKDLLLLEQYCNDKKLQIVYSKEIFKILLEALYQYRVELQMKTHNALLGAILYIYCSITNQKRPYNRICPIIKSSPPTIRKVQNILITKKNFRNIIVNNEEIKKHIKQFTDRPIIMKELVWQELKEIKLEHKVSDIHERN